MQAGINVWFIVQCNKVIGSNNDSLKELQLTNEGCEVTNANNTFNATKY
jgi:hypothetical protein